MPNWVSCDLIVNGNKEELLRFKHNVKSKEKAIDTNKILPYPDKFRFWKNKYRFSKTKKDEPKPMTKEEILMLKLSDDKEALDEAFQIGYNNGGYDWEHENWGCKWGICDCSCETDIKDMEKKDELFYIFNTAWSPPCPLIKALSEKYPKLLFTMKYWEGANGFRGIFKVRDGIIKTDKNYNYKGGRGG